MEVAEQMSGEASCRLDFRIVSLSGICQPTWTVMSNEEPRVMIRGPIGNVSADSLHLTRIPSETSLIIARGELKERRIQTHDANRMATYVDCCRKIPSQNTFFDIESRAV